MMNTKRTFFKRLVAGSIALFTGNTLLAAEQQKPQKKQGEFMHVVYLWLNEPENKAHRETFVNNTNAFMKEIDEVITWYVGMPANTPREIVDNSYTFSLVVNFKNREEHDIYQEHEAHKKFVADTSMLWNKVQVYDSLKV